MAEDTRLAVNHLTDIMIPALNKRKEERIELDRETKNYWNRLKKRLPEDITTGIEENPNDETAQNNFKDTLEQFVDRYQNIKMSTAIFLAQKGVEL
ncbi:MAG: hypothetical protein ACRBFS_23560 [Aureispira sp.]